MARRIALKSDEGLLNSASSEVRSTTPMKVWPMVVAVAVCLSLSCWDHETLLALQFRQLNVDAFVKSRHPGSRLSPGQGHRGPDIL
jgi:hypothetical protein